MQMRARLLLAAVILSSPALTACGQGRPVVTLPPANLTVCAGEPATPELPGPGVERDKAVLDYVLALRSAWADCAAKVAGVHEWSAGLAR